MDDRSIPDSVLKFLYADPMIMDHPINIDTRTVDGDTLLQRLILRRNTEGIKILLELGVNVNERGDMGNTALHYAVEKERFDKGVFSLLIEFGGDVTIKNEFGNNVLEWALSSSNTVNLGDLIEQLTKVDKRN